MFSLLARSGETSGRGQKIVAFGKVCAQTPCLQTRILCLQTLQTQCSRCVRVLMAAGAPKVRPLCPKSKLERPRYNLRLKQYDLIFKLLTIMRRNPYLECSLRKTLRKMNRKTFRKTLCGAQQAPHSKVKPVGKQCAHGKDIAKCGRI